MAFKPEEWRNEILSQGEMFLKLYDYLEARRRMVMTGRSHPVYPSVFVSWDNSPRRGENGIVIVNSSPENFELGLAEAVASVQDKPFDERLVFVNAWNEWAEGNHLEPDQRHGLGYLEAVRRVNVVRDREPDREAPRSVAGTRP